MSWGERSCTRELCKQENCTTESCNVDCPEYKWDGKTKPDSFARQAVVSKEMLKNYMHGCIAKEVPLGFIASTNGDSDLGGRVLMAIKTKWDKLNGR